MPLTSPADDRRLRLRLCSGAFARILTRALSADAVTLGGRVFLSRSSAGEVLRNSEAGKRLVLHELAHVAQFSREGIPRVLWNYAAAYARGRLAGLSHAAAYLAIPYERDARAAESEVTDGEGSAVSSQLSAMRSFTETVNS